MTASISVFMSCASSFSVVAVKLVPFPSPLRFLLDFPHYDMWMASVWTSLTFSFEKRAVGLCESRLDRISKSSYDRLKPLVNIGRLRLSDMADTEMYLPLWGRRARALITSFLFVGISSRQPPLWRWPLPKWGRCILGDLDNRHRVSGLCLPWWLSMAKI